MTASGFKLLDAYVEVHADASKVTSSAADQIRGGSSVLDRAGSGLGSALMGGMSGVVGGLVGGVVSSLTYPIVNGVQDALSSAFQAAKSAVIDYNGQLEQANIGFTTMLGSAGRAKDFISDLQVFAKKTPFAFTDLTNYAQQMIGYGISSQKVIPYLTALGDAAAGAGKSSAELGNAVLAFEQMAAKGTVDLGNLNQLTNAGIPAISILAEKYHVSKGALIDMVSAGKVASDVALPKLIQGIEKGTKSTASFGGMMDKQSHTLQGALGNISDGFNQVISKAGQPFFKLTERIASKISDFAGSDGFTNWAKRTSAGLNKFLGDKEMRKIFGGLTDAVKDNLPELESFGRDALGGIKESVPIIAKDMPKISHAITVIGDAIEDDGPAFHDFITFLAGIPGTIADVVNFFQILDVQVDTLRDTIHADVKGVLGFFKDLPDEFHTIGSMVVQGLIGGLTAGWPDVMGAVSGLVNSIPLATRKLLGIASPSKVMKQLGTWAAQGLKKGLLGSVDQIKAASEKMGKAMTDPVEKRLISLSKTRQKVIDRLKDAKDKLADLRSSKADYKSNVMSQVMGAGDVTTLFSSTSGVTSGAMPGSLDGRTYTGSYTTTSGGTSGLTSVRAGLRSLLNDTKKFTANLKTLVKRGLDRFTVQQLIAAGPTASLPITTELLNDKAGFNDIVSLQKQLNIASTALGSYTAGYTYDGQINSTKATISRLSAREDHITAVMVVEARKIDEVDKVVKAVNALAQTAKAKNAAKKKAKK